MLRQVFAHRSLDTIDVPALVSLIEEAFGQRLPPVYLDKLRSRMRCVYMSESKRGAAVVTNEGPHNLPYLDKFAVSPSSQGDKLGEEVWSVLVHREPRLFWRSRSANRVNPWYFDRSHGSYRVHMPNPDVPDVRDATAMPSTGPWTVFWRGLGDDEIMDAIRVAVALKPTFSLKS